MKKLFLGLAFLAVSLVSCNSDNHSSTPDESTIVNKSAVDDPNFCTTPSCTTTVQLLAVDNRPQGNITVRPCGYLWIHAGDELTFTSERTYRMVGVDSSGQVWEYDLTYRKDAYGNWNCGDCIGKRGRRSSHRGC